MQGGLDSDDSLGAEATKEELYKWSQSKVRSTQTMCRTVQEQVLRGTEARRMGSSTQHPEVPLSKKQMTQI